MKKYLKVMENNKLNFNLNRCLIYEVFIKKNNIEFYVGQIQFTEENEYWIMKFTLSNTDKNLIWTEFCLKTNDTGFFSTFRTCENETNLLIKLKGKFMDFFKESSSIRLVRSYNF